MAVEFRILGPLEARRDGHLVELGGRRERALLAILLVHANEVVSTDRIADELYGEHPPRTAAASLQNAVSRLRKTLGVDVVKTKPPGYTLEIGEEALDAARFTKLLAKAPTEPASRAEALREALGLWRGEALGDFAYEPFAQSEIARLEELRLVAIEEQIECDLALGKQAVLVGELAALIAEHPFRERFRRQIMLALYGVGRQADALEAYQQARQTFVDELGIEPSPALQELERAILRQDTALSGPQEVAFPARVEVTRPPERRQTVTVLFADVMHSERLARALDPEALGEVLGKYFQIARRVLDRHGGAVEKFVGDAVMGVFGVPRVHEDDALRAVRAGTALVGELAELNRELSTGWGVQVDVRVGLSTGEVVVGGAHELLAVGEAVIVAKSLEEKAGANELLLGETTWRLVRDAVEAQRVELGAEDGRHAWRLERVLDAPAFARRLETPLVGRERELRLLGQVFEQAVADRRAHLLTVLGPAGIGKTRLALELAAGAGRDAGIVTGHCPSFGDALTYWPLREIVAQAGDAGVELLELLEGGATDEIRPAARTLLEGLASDRPLVVVLEDLHWAEPTFLDLVEYLAEWLQNAPVLLLCLARLELLEDRTGWGGGLPNATSLLLEPLAEPDADAMVTALLGGAELDSAARGRVLDVAEGNPLFVEQLLSALVLGEADELPPTIEALLAARLDRLGPGERALVEVAAIAGRDFTPGSVVELLPGDAASAVDRHLAALVRRELLRPLHSRPGDDRFAFRHALVRDAAYRSTPKARRAELHRRFARSLEEGAPDEDELVGYHLEQAYRLATELGPVDGATRLLAGEGGDRLGNAGIRAWKRGDAPAATNLLERATSLLPSGERRRELRCELGPALRATGALEQARDVLEETIAASVAAGDPRLEHRARIELVAMRLFGDPAVRAEDLIEATAEAIPVFEAAGDDRSLGRAWLHAGHANGALLCRNEAWCDAAERARRHYERAGWRPSTAISSIAAALYHGPTPVSEAMRRCEALVAESEDAFTQASVCCFIAGLHALEGRFAEARELVERAGRRYEELGEVTALVVDIAGMRGEIERFAGAADQAGAILVETCERLERMGATEALSSRAAELAEVCCLQERWDEALEWTRVSEANASEDDLSAQFSWRGVRGKVLAQLGDRERGERLAREGLALAEQTDAVNQLAKAFLDVAAVCRFAGQSSEAIELAKRALALYERKGNLIGAERTRQVLAAPSPA